MSTKDKTTDTSIEQNNPELNQHQKENLPVFKNENNLINKRNPKPQERQINNNITNRTEIGIKPREHIPLPSKSDTPSIFTEPKNYVSSSPKNTTTRLTSYSSKMILGESTNTACNIASSTDNSQNTTMTSIQTTTTTTPSYIPSHSQKERNVKHSTINLKSEMISVDLKPQSQINFGNYIENLNNSTLNLSNTINQTSNSTSHNVNVPGNPLVPVTTPSGSVTDLSSSIPKSHHTDYQFQNEGSSVYQQSLYSVNLNTNNFPQLTSTANNNNNLNSSNMNLDPSSIISNISPSNQGMTNANHVTATGLGVTANNNSTVNSTGVNPFNRVKSKKSKGGYYNNDNDEDEEFRYYDSSSINNNTTEIHSQQEKRHTRKLSIRSTVTSNFDLESVYIPPSSNYHHPPRSPHAPSFAGNSRDYYTTNQNMYPVSASNQNINNTGGNNGYGPSNSQYLATTPKLHNDFGPFVQNDDQFDNRSTNSYDFNTSSNNDMIQMTNQRIRPTHRSSRATLNNGTNTLFADNGYNSKYWHSDHMRSPTSTSVNVFKQGANMQSNNKMNDPLQSYPNSNTIISQVRQVSQRLFSSNRIGLKKEISNPQINYNSNSNFGNITSNNSHIQTTGRIYSSIHSFNPGSPTRSTGGNELSLNSDQYSIAETVCIKKSPSKIKKGKNKKNVNDKKKKQQRGDRILSKVDSKDGNRTLTSYKLNDSNNENLETTLEDISNVDDNSIVAKGQDLTESSIHFDHEAVLTNNDNEENEEDDENEDDCDDDDDDENDLDSVEESSEDEEERLYLNRLLVIDDYERRSGSTRSDGTGNRSFSVNQLSVNGYDINYDNNNSKGKGNGGGSCSRYLHNNPKDLDIFEENQQRKDNYSRNSNIEDRRSTNFINPNIEQNISNESLNSLANRYCNSYGSAYDSDDFQFLGLSSNQNPKEFYRQKSGNYHSPHGIEDQENHGKGRSIRRQNGRVHNRQSYDFNSPHNYKSIYYRTNLILKIMSLVFYFSLISLFLILLGKFFILKNFHNKLNAFTINKIDNILISDEMLVFDIFTSTRNTNVQDIVINDVDVDVFLVTEHYNDKIEEMKKDGVATIVEKTTILLGNTKQLSTPLEFKGILSSSSALSLSSELSKVWYYINHKNEIIPVNSKGQIKITDPGKTTRDKLQASGNALGILDIGDDKWHNIINHKFTLIMRGSLTYHLTVINDDEIMGISYSTVVHGQAANDSLIATNNLDI